ncbi:MAG: sigma-70 family RNA polymerase sigma factor [Planctomycetes bacterium]|nr:sigma-70 family RNA polymerase sigma factor [Planctomycetota bacterium]
MDSSAFARATHGDRSAVEELLARNLPRLRAYVRARAGRHLLARESHGDLVQTVCREALQDLDRFEFHDEVRFRHWLCQVAWHKLAERARRLRAERRDPAREAHVDVHDSAFQDVWSTLTPSRDACAREQAARVEAALDELTDEQREAIVLHRVVGIDYATLAASTGRSENAARNLVHRGLARLATLLRQRRAADDGAR